ncbi:acetyl-coenzyme A synthetase, cytoplasmic-like [Sinocyclocheilus rhinocerous]|uniref:acetyl-coenzyme A synthetase, cytoplasmic-like n=1 Tax=Sinocyclocheilus rhinocerous TaxID=307959 RepID=UPI0007BAB705|nr:PREDICTED: acetyl-coenzyme A synthetase, cytoplasmic-like [Sinocyclocheilus rhinocerous]
MSPVSDSTNRVIPGPQEPEKTYHPSDGLFTDAHVPDFDAYLAIYKKSTEEPEEFWADVAQEFYWKKPPSGQMLQYNFDVNKGNIYIKFMEGAKTNICYNVLDRNVHERNLGEKVAYYWEGNSPNHHQTITYNQLLRNVCRCANALKLLGVKNGDRVAIYLPMIPELVYTMLACARIGAVHSIVFAGFSSESLCERIMDAQCNILVTADGVYRGDKLINLKKIASEALERCKERYVPVCCSPLSEEPLFTSTSHPSIILHNLKKKKIAAIIVNMYDLSSLRVLGTVGEPINPEAWLWYYDVVGQQRCPVIDTFWQTETGGHVLTPLPAATPLKPGSATCPFFGVQPAILNEHGEELEGEAEGYLVFRKPWPGIMRGVYGNQERFESTYFRKFPGFYVTGDGCRRDKDGYYWITGRIDDMLNVSGHLLSTAEVEAALTEHPSVAEAAVVSRPHAVKGECLYCFVTLKDHKEFNRTLMEELKRKVREKIGPIATPDFIQNAPGLPKTRSGKIMRRVLRQIARNEKDLGDLSTLADPKVVEVLFSQRCEAAA